MAGLGDVAVIGMSGRFPGARSVQAFWDNLVRGHESISVLTPEELERSGVSAADRASPDFVPAGAFLDDIDRFDAAFFGYSPAEARTLDPQHRFFLECAWEALEDAGQLPESVRGQVGVFAGASLSLYPQQKRPWQTHPEFGALQFIPDLEELLGNDKDYLATRVSYKLDLRGPSLGVQTACSTSLVAIHLAANALLSYQCDLALAGGVTLRVPHRAGYLTGGARIGSRDGHCRPFDAEGQGPVFGNGVGVVVLKRLEDALAARDSIYAVLKGSAVNNDGAAKVGFAAPSAEGQSEVVATALALAETPVDTLGYVEAHGTGTALGDPIEISALNRAFQGRSPALPRCALGSVKGNVGHLESAAGVTGFIKAALALRTGLLPPTLHFRRANPEIDFAGGPFSVVDRLTPWQGLQGAPRRAGVSSFGLGGTNAHVILEQAPAPAPRGDAPARPFHVLTLSARTPEALQEAVGRLATQLKATPALDLEDVSYTLRVGRRAFEHRVALACASGEEAVARLTDAALVRGARRAARSPRVAFLFPGGGAQHARMGRDLYAAEPLFRQEFDRCAALFSRHLGVELREAVFGGSSLEGLALGLPALFAVEYALARVWMARGVTPGVMIGHSAGEYTAACLAGVFSLEDAVALVALRGRLMATMPRGGLLGVPMSPAALQPHLESRLSLAAVNAPELCVVSGPVEPLEALAAALAQRGVETRRLHIDVAAHSAAVEQITGDFQRFLTGLRLNAPRIPFASNLTGRRVTDAEAVDPRYWVRHLRETVRFSDGLSLLLEDPEVLLLEVGPGTTLSSLARSHPAWKTQPVLASLPHPRDPRRESFQFLETLGALWSHGVAIDWTDFDAPRAPGRVSLPTYPFQRQSYWVETPAAAPLRARPPREAGLLVPSWRRAGPVPRRERTLERCWLLLLEDGEVGSGLAARLREEGQPVVTVRPGDDFAALLAELEKRSQWPSRVVHLRNLTAPGRLVARARAFEELVGLLHCLGTRAEPVRVDVVSSGLWDVLGDEALEPIKALLLGPVRVAGRERPWLQVRSIDGVWPASPEAREQLVARLRAELDDGPEEQNVALRGAHRWLPVLESVPAEARAGAQRPRERGVYWITGGLGGVGLALARHLGTRYQARLVLTTRTPFLERERWDAWLAEHGPEDATHRTVHVLREILAAGGEVLVLSADVTREAEQRAVVERTMRVFGRLEGVIHAAGLVEPALLGHKTPEQVERVLGPKVLGADVLLRVCAPLALDFVVFCSSLNAVLGPPGLVDYCAANAYLDALAVQRTREGAFTLSLGWDGWREVGRAVDARETLGAWAGRGLGTAEAVALFEQTLAGELPHVLVTAGDLSERQAALARESVTHTPAAPRPSPQVAPRDDVERTLVGLWASVLGLESIGIHDHFMELGGHSLMGSRLMARLNACFHVALPLQALFERPTVAAMSAHLSALLAARDMRPSAPLGAEEEEERF